MHRPIDHMKIQHNPPFDQIQNLSCVELRFCHLDDTVAPHLYKYLVHTPSTRQLRLSHNTLGDETYTSIAQALCISTSMRIIDLQWNLHVHFSDTSAAFVHSIRLNHTFSKNSQWRLYGLYNEYPRLKCIADAADVPSMLEFLLHTHKC